MIRQSVAVRLGCDIKKHPNRVTRPTVRSLCIPLTMIGETSMCPTRKNNKFEFSDLVLKNLDVELLSGTPFVELINNVAVLSAIRIISLADGTTYIMVKLMLLTNDTQCDMSTCCERHLLTLPCGLANSWKSTCPPKGSFALCTNSPLPDP